MMNVEHVASQPIVEGPSEAQEDNTIAQNDSFGTEETMCAHCQKLTMRVCSDCTEAPVIDDHSSDTYYCSTTCQKVDQKNHKALCLRLSTRKQCYRIGEVLQSMFYMYRERMFDRAIEKIMVENGNLFVYEGRREFRPGSWRVRSILQTFPNGLFSNKIDPQAVLAQLASTDALAYLHDLARYLLSEVSFAITEPTVMVKNSKRELVCIPLAPEDVVALGATEPAARLPPQGKIKNRHDILQVTLRNGGEEFVFDITGAQYGFHCPVIPLTQYFTQRVSKRVTEGGDAAFGRHKQQSIQNWCNAAKGSLERMAEDFKLETSRRLVLSTKDWEAGLGIKSSLKMKVRDIVKLSNPEFKKKLDELVAYVEDDVRDYISFVVDRRGWEANRRDQRRAHLDELAKKGISATMLALYFNQQLNTEARSIAGQAFNKL